MFGFNEYELAGIICFVVFVSWIAALVGFEIWSHVWAWVDESKQDRNLLMKWFTKTIDPYRDWKYPVYWSSMAGIRGYAKDKRLDGSKDSNLENGVDYITEYRKDITYKNNIAHWVAGTSAAPFAILIGLKLYPVTAAIATLILVAHLSRFTRRLSKKYNAHAADKAAHVQSEVKE